LSIIKKFYQEGKFSDDPFSFRSWVPILYEWHQRHTPPKEDVERVKKLVNAVVLSVFQDLEYLEETGESPFYQNHRRRLFWEIEGLSKKIDDLVFFDLVNIPKKKIKEEIERRLCELKKR